MFLNTSRYHQFYIKKISVKKITLLIVSGLCLVAFSCFSQQVISSDTLSLNYSQPAEYEIAGVVISGAGSLDNSVLLSIAGLYVGDKIKVPGEETAKAIKNIWK
jgi:hypothetical protein